MFGIALVAHVRSIAQKPDRSPLLQLSRLSPNKRLRKLWRKSLREFVARSPQEFLNVHRRMLQKAPMAHYNFLAVERYPIVSIGKKHSYCLSLDFLDSKLGIGIMHRLGETFNNKNDSKRFRDFLGDIFEEYINQICRRAFTASFYSKIMYGRPEQEAADGWVLNPPAAAVIEAKSGFLLLETTLSGSFEGFEYAFRQTFLRAAKQLSRVIDDFKASRFEVAGLAANTITIIYPVLVTLRYLPMEAFVADYIRRELSSNNLLTQPSVRELTIVAAKDLEVVEAQGAHLVDLLAERLTNEEFKSRSFSDFLYQKYSRGPDGFKPNEHLVSRYRELLSGSAQMLFGRRLGTKKN